FEMSPEQPEEVVGPPRKSCRVDRRLVRLCAQLGDPAVDDPMLVSHRRRERVRSPAGEPIHDRVEDRSSHSACGLMCFSKNDTTFSAVFFCTAGSCAESVPIHSW